MTPGGRTATNSSAALRPLLFVLPIAFFAVSWVLRDNGGPFWIWHIVDPSYAYLVDSLNLVNLRWIQNVYHPGTSVAGIGALVLKAAYPFTGGEEIAKAVLTDPEWHLRLISTVFIALNAAALGLIGAVGYRLFQNPILALVLQTGPFLSMVTLKNSYHVKPEALLVFTMLMLSVTVLLALRPGELERNRGRYAIVFGAIAGFGVATKVIAAPIFILPLFLLAHPGAVIRYGMASLGFFLLFTLPGLGSADLFWAWMVKISMGSGAYGGGDQTVIDAARYPLRLAKLFSRPVINVPVVIGLIVLAVGWVRRRGEGTPWSAEARALAGYCVAVLAQIIVVAKQPAAFYLVPSYMAAPLAIVLIQRVIANASSWNERLRARAGAGFALLIGGLIIAQGFSVARLDRELTGKHRTAAAVNNAAFAACARIYFFPASSRSFALAHGDWWSGGRFSNVLAAQGPANDFWFEQNTNEFRDWKGPRDIRAVIGNASCVMLRGGHRGPVSRYLREKVPGFTYKDTCSTRDEAVFTSNVDCSGRTAGN